MKFVKKQFLKARNVILVMFSLLVRCITHVKKKRVVCWSYHFNKYSCNPRYFAEYLVTNYPNEYEVYWIQNKNTDISDINEKIHLVYTRTWKYFFIINTAHILIYNTRVYKYLDYWFKRKGQIYIMTWHATMGLKKIEKQVAKELGERYEKMAKRDSNYCDLIVSGCKYYTEVYKNDFWYSGEILECGNPRNDMFFINNDTLKKKVYEKYGIEKNKKLLLYAPTFRKDYNLSYYKIDWTKVVEVINSKFGDDFVIFLRLHPNFMHKGIDVTEELLCDNRVIDVTDYPDMQELLCIADILITDYSSSMFDFGILNKPCFLYATDYKSYNRGFTISLEELPFPLSRNMEELLKELSKFNLEQYSKALENFNRNRIGLLENGRACQGLYKWLNKEISNV